MQAHAVAALGNLFTNEQAAKVDIRLPGKEDTDSHGARPIY